VSQSSSGFHIARQEDIVVTTCATLIVVFAATSSAPIAASIARHAEDALQQTTSVDDSNWRRLSLITRGTEVAVSTADRPDLRRVFITHDDASITVLNLNDPILPRVASQTLRQVAVVRLDVFDLDRMSRGFETDNGVRVGSDGVFVGSSRICEIQRIVHRIPRSEVTLVQGLAEVTASRGATVAGVVIGEVLGLATFAGATECRIAESISGCKLQLMAPLWMPIAGGTLGYVLTRHVDRRVFYRRD
jgi:hypothetical protein